VPRVQRAAGENITPDTGRATDMFRTEKAEKMKQLKPKAVVFTVLWLVLLGAAMLFIAIAGHI
jgi:hypothetical protein